MSKPHFNVSMLAKGKARIEIYDEIGPSWAGMIDEKTVAAALKEIGNVKEIELRVNSLGGDAYDGLAICNMLKAHPAKVNGHVEGIAASAASILLMGCDTITIPKNALLMIHEPWTFAVGNAEDMQKAIAQLDSTTAAGIETYAAKNTKKSREEIAALMKEETWYTGEEAVEAGFADRTEAEVQLPSVEPKAAPQNRFRNAPSQFASLLAISMRATEVHKMADTTVTTPETPEVAPVVQAAAPAPVQAAPVVKDTTGDERKRCSEIASLCNQIGKPLMASEFIEKGATIEQVQMFVKGVMCQDRPAVDNGGSGAGTDETPADEHAKYKAEYAADKKMLVKMGISEKDYIASRLVTDEHQGRVAMLASAND